jgi:hypothetical protein
MSIILGGINCYLDAFISTMRPQSHTHVPSGAKAAIPDVQMDELGMVKDMLTSNTRRTQQSQMLLRENKRRTFAVNEI